MDFDGIDSDEDDIGFDVYEGIVAEIDPPVRIRRPYRFQARIGHDHLDDYEFLNRFRLSKPTVIKIVELLEERLVFFE